MFRTKLKDFVSLPIFSISSTYMGVPPSRLLTLDGLKKRPSGVSTSSTHSSTAASALPPSL